MLTPYSIQIDTVTLFNFASSYLTREFTGDEIANLLATHPDYADDKTLPAAERVKRATNMAHVLGPGRLFRQCPADAGPRGEGLSQA